MQTYHDAIGRLTEHQKVRLATDLHTLADPSLPPDLPRVRIARLQDILRQARLPSLGVLARTWDTALLADLTACLCREQAQQGVRWVITPGAKGCIGHAETSLSEDPFLSSKLAAAFATGAARAGVLPIPEGYEAPEGIDARVRYEHLTAPFQALHAEVNYPAVVAEGGACLAEDLRGAVTLRSHPSDKETVLAVARGELCIDGSPAALQRALLNHRRLSADIEQGRATLTELEEAVAGGEAISEAAVDAALERLFSLLENFRQEPVPTGADREEFSAIAAKALPASSVLLENQNGLLPLRSPVKVAVVGALAESDGMTVSEIEARLTALGHNFAGYACGYTAHGERDDALTEEAENLCRVSDVTLVFLGTDGAHQERLPAVQLALCHRLGQLKKRTVAVVSADGNADLGFLGLLPYPPEAVLLAPLQAAGGVANALDIILGQSIAGGRLTRTMVDHTLDFSSRRALRTGPFLGYRFYDTIQSGFVFPFGHGLGSADKTGVEYSSLHIGADSVEFTVTNTKNRPVAALPQIYLGMIESDVLRPRKELIGFRSLHLSPGEEKTVTLPLRGLPVPDGERIPRVERGRYLLSVGSSVSEIALEGTFSYGDARLTPDGEEPFRYLPSVTNIFKEHYTLEADEIPMKSSLRNLLFGIAAIVLAACVKIYDIVTLSNSPFLNIVAALLAVGAIACFILEMQDRKKDLQKKQEQTEEANQALFRDADTISVPSAEELFDQATDNSAEEVAQGFAELTDEYDYFADVDKELTFSAASDDLVRLAAEKGIALDRKTALGIFAAFASSRLVMVKDMSEEHFSALVSLLGAYFDCPAGIDTVDETYQTERDVLFQNAGVFQNSIARQAMVSMQSARDKRRNLHFAPLTNVDPEGLAAYFAPYAQYVRAPYSANSVILQDTSGRGISYKVPENLWFLMNLRSDSATDALPAPIAEVATVNHWHIDLTEPTAAEETAPCRSFPYGQMLYLCDKLRGNLGTDEAIWKKIDELERFAKGYAPFHIGNKLWICLEAYLSVLTDAKVELPEAVDEAVAVKLLPSLIHALSGKIPRDAKGLGEKLDDLFGPENTAVCRRTIKTSGASIL